jgi:hypothetical protein
MIGMVKKRINDLEIEKAELERQIDARPTLLDQFAMAALTGLLACNNPKNNLKEIEEIEEICEAAYDYAEEMMTARWVKGDRCV